MKHKKTKIEDTKNVQEFKETLCEEFVNKVYAECFEGHEPFSKDQMLTQGRIAIRLAYNHIRNKYVKQERKKYNAIIDDYERYLQRHIEQEQKMKQKISSLQSENEKLDNFNEELRKNYENCVNYWKEENAKVQEQLKNTFCPKYKIYQTVWFIDDFDIDNNCGRYRDSKNIQKRVRECFVESIVQVAGKTFLYHIQPEDLTEFEQDPKEYTFFWEMSKQEYDLFATEAKAQKYLEEHK